MCVRENCFQFIMHIPSARAAVNDEQDYGQRRRSKRAHILFTILHVRPLDVRPTQLTSDTLVCSANTRVCAYAANFWLRHMRSACARLQWCDGAIRLSLYTAQHTHTHKSFLFHCLDFGCAEISRKAKLDCCSTLFSSICRFSAA